MPKIVCSAIECKYNSDRHLCTANNIKLRDSYVHTVHEGFQHYNTCLNYEMSHEVKMMEAEFRELFKKMEEMD